MIPRKSSMFLYSFAVTLLKALHILLTVSFNLWVCDSPFWSTFGMSPVPVAPKPGTEVRREGLGRTGCHESVDVTGATCGIELGSFGGLGELLGEVCIEEYPESAPGNLGNLPYEYTRSSLNPSPAQGSMDGSSTSYADACGSGCGSSLGSVDQGLEFVDGTSLLKTSSGTASIGRSTGLSASCGSISNMATSLAEGNETMSTHNRVLMSSNESLIGITYAWPNASEATTWPYTLDCSSMTHDPLSPVCRATDIPLVFRHNKLHLMRNHIRPARVRV